MSQSPMINLRPRSLIFKNKKNFPTYMKSVEQWRKSGRQIIDEFKEEPCGLLVTESFDLSQTPTSKDIIEKYYKKGKTFNVYDKWLSGIKKYSNWRDVPENLKSTTQWKKVGRLVLPICLRSPMATKTTYATLFKAKFNEVWLKDRYLPYSETEVLVKFKNSLVKCKAYQYEKQIIPLFDISQTVLWKPTPSEQAFNNFCDIYYAMTNKDNHYALIIQNNEKIWTPKKYDSVNWWSKLTINHIEKHLNHKTPIGVVAEDFTKFIILDHDLHDYDSKKIKVFLEQTKILFKAILGVGTWHLEMDPSSFRGSHYVFVLDKPILISKATNLMRSILTKLDQMYPKVKIKATNAGMKSFAEMEIFPNFNDPLHSRRLPMGQNMIVYTDKENSGIKDLEGYTSWIKNPHRKLYDKKALLELIKSSIKSCSASAGTEYGVISSFEESNSSKSKVKKITRNSKGIWRGNLAINFWKMWMENDNSGIELNTHILVFVELAYCYGADQKETFDVLIELIKKLGKPAVLSSKRLLNKQYKRIESSIKATIKKVFSGKIDSKLRFLQIFIKNRKQFNPLKPSTWESIFNGKSFSLTFNWPLEMKQKLCKAFNPILYGKRKKLDGNHNRRTIKFINLIIQVVYSRGDLPNGVSYEYIMEVLKNNFPSIKATNRKKISNLIKAFEAYEILKIEKKGVKGRFGTWFKIGVNAKMAIVCE